jgi:hypothetical protein
MLAGAQVIDPAAIADAGVVFGATVEADGATGERVTYQIVGEDEADLKHGKISVSRPLPGADWQIRGRLGRGPGTGPRVRRLAVRYQ